MGSLTTTPMEAEILSSVPHGVFSHGELAACPVAELVISVPPSPVVRPRPGTARLEIRATSGAVGDMGVTAYHTFARLTIPSSGRFGGTTAPAAGGRATSSVT